MFLQCPNCKADFSRPKSVTPDSMALEGDIFLCGSCAHISVLHSLKLELATLEEFEKLTKNEKADLKFAVKAIIANVHRDKQNKIIVPEWYR